MLATKFYFFLYFNVRESGKFMIMKKIPLAGFQIGHSYLLLFRYFADCKLHLAVQRDYPKAASLPLPPNVDPAETTRFSPLRNRDINGSAMINHYSNVIDITLEQGVEAKVEKSVVFEDPHLELHDSSSPVSLNSVMQSMVPEPFSPTKFSHLNMPGGGWMQQSKFLSHELCSSHYTNLRQEVRSDWSSYQAERSTGIKNGLFFAFARPRVSCNYFLTNKRFLSQNQNQNSNQNQSQTIQESETPKRSLTRGEQLKKAVKDYGSTVIVFHVALSLCSLGICYVLVSRYAFLFTWELRGFSKNLV
jgi:hypothetical protein